MPTYASHPHSPRPLSLALSSLSVAAPSASFPFPFLPSPLLSYTIPCSLPNSLSRRPSCALPAIPGMDALLRTNYSPFVDLYEAPYPLTAAPAPAPTRSAGSGRPPSPGARSRGAKEPQRGVSDPYDEASGMWKRLWGDHMHHGFYDPGASIARSDHRLAQVRMIEEALAFAGFSADDSLKKPKKIVDVGCGIGGSSRYLAKKYGAPCQGITLSRVQAQRAQALAVAEELYKVSFQVADALEQPFPDAQFDLVWSMESGEHMPDKRKFVGELARVAAPGATIIIVTLCHRDLLPSEDSLQPDEINLLNKICDAYYLPSWCSTADYIKIAQSLSLEDIKTADWSENVVPFCPAVIRSALTWHGLTSLLRSGWKTIKRALAMPLMIQGYNKKLIKYSIITCRKPE